MATVGQSFSCLQGLCTQVDMEIFGGLCISCLMPFLGCQLNRLRPSPSTAPHIWRVASMPRSPARPPPVRLTKQVLSGGGQRVCGISSQHRRGYMLYLDISQHNLRTQLTDRKASVRPSHKISPSETSKQSRTASKS